MNKQQQVINYLSLASNGLLAINNDQAQKIIDIVNGMEGSNYSPTAFVKLSQWNAHARQYQLIRTIKTTDEKVNKHVMRALDETPIEEFIMYECYNAKGEKQG